MPTPKDRSADSPFSSPLVLLGQTVKEIRTDRTLTQQELADRCGFNRTFIIAIEKGRQNASAMTLFTIAQALGVLPSELFRSFTRTTMRRVGPR
jgi:transcriptional regulator with XRE-family HTH domain